MTTPIGNMTQEKRYNSILKKLGINGEGYLP